MDVKQMTYILTIAQEGGISKAAAKLFITQSALEEPGARPFTGKE